MYACLIDPHPSDECPGCSDDNKWFVAAYPSTMSSPYFTGTLVEAVVEMFSCSGEYIGHGWLRFGGGGGCKMGEITQGEGDRKGKRGEGSGEVLIEWRTGKGGGGRGRVSWASAPPSHASCVCLLQHHLSCPAEEKKELTQRLVCLLKRAVEVFKNTIFNLKFSTFPV